MPMLAQVGTKSYIKKRFIALPIVFYYLELHNTRQNCVKFFLIEVFVHFQAAHIVGARMLSFLSS